MAVNISITLECRSTGRGAYTSADLPQNRDAVKVICYDNSRSGNHWTERIMGPMGAEYDVIDITNSGKHHCHRARVADNDEGFTVIKRYAEDGPCALCFPPLPSSNG